MTSNVNGVIRWVDETDLGEADLVMHPDLNRMLDPHRTTRPLPLRCGKDRCRTVLAYWALHSSMARIIPGPKRVPRKSRAAGEYPAWPQTTPGRPQPPETSLTGGDADLRFPDDFDWSGRVEKAIEWAEKGDERIRFAANPGVASGYPLRWRFVCPGPVPGDYPMTNSQMLLRFLRAIAYEHDEIEASRLW